MHDLMMDHGLDPPTLGTDTGYFQVIFRGPGENVARLRVPDSRLRVAPSVEARLNERQRRAMLQALESGSVTTRWCMQQFDIARDTAHRDLAGLVKLKLLESVGSGRGAKYVPSQAESL